MENKSINSSKKQFIFHQISNNQVINAENQYVRFNNDQYSCSIKKNKKDLKINCEQTRCTAISNNKCQNRQDKKQSQLLYNFQDFTLELRKKQIINLNKTKIEQFKTLLPPYLIQKLPHSIQLCLDAACHIDKYLLRQTNKTDAFINIKNNLQIKIKLKIQLKQIYQTLYLAPDLYCILQDPLKNITISLGNGQSFLHRKHKLRKLAYEFCLDRQGSVKQIPQFKVKIYKTNEFYPIKQKNKRTELQEIKQSKGNITNKPSEQFINQINDIIKEKEQQDSKITHKNLSFKHLNLKQMQKFCNILQKVFLKHGVSNIFAVNLIQSLKKKEQLLFVENCKHELQKIKQCGKFIEYRQNRAGNKIVHVNLQEKKKTLQKLKRLFNQNESKQ